MLMTRRAYRLIPRKARGSMVLKTEQSRKRFRARLREWRLKRGLTQEELARKADVPTISVSHFETGHRFPNAESLRRLADALGVSADYLLGRVKEPTGEDLEAADPEIAGLFRRFQGMSEEAREQIKQLFETVEAMDKKKRRSRKPK
jgi:transcriptional regulator with XRE-family HTH domain